TTSLAHRVPQGVRTIRLHSPQTNAYEKEVQTPPDTQEGNDGSARCPVPDCPCGGQIPIPAAATSPLDYTTGSEHWVKDRAGVRGFLVARRLVGWDRWPLPFRT